MTTTRRSETVEPTKTASNTRTPTKKVVIRIAVLRMILLSRGRRCRATRADSGSRPRPTSKPTEANRRRPFLRRRRRKGEENKIQLWNDACT